MNGLRPAGARVLLALGTAGDRSDDLLHSLGAIGARGSDEMVIVHKSSYLRGRDESELTALYLAGAAEVGVHDVPVYPSELDGLQALVEAAQPGDVIAVMCHQDRDLLVAWLADRGATVDSPATLRHKVLQASPSLDG